MSGAPSLFHLLAPRLLAAQNGLRRGRTKPVLLSVFAAAFWAGSFVFFERTLAYFQTITALGPVLTQRLLVLIFVSFFAVLLLSNVVTALTTFYGAAEVSLLLAAPLSARRVHQARFVETLAASSWMVLLFGLPAFVAYGVVYRAGPAFYLGTVATLVPFLVVPAAIGVLTATAIVLVFPARRVREVLLVASVTLTAAAYLAFRLLRPERLADPSGLAGFAAFLADVGAPSPFLPTTSARGRASRSSTWDSSPARRRSSTSRARASWSASSCSPGRARRRVGPVAAASGRSRAGSVSSPPRSRARRVSCSPRTSPSSSVTRDSGRSSSC
jgi:ABC-2 type transport system permease protein